jgi:CBS domain-containing protein
MAHIRVSEVMTGGTECLHENDSILDAAKRFAQLDVDALPICSHEGRLTGVLTERDIVARVLALGQDPAKTKAGDLTYGQPITAWPDTPLEAALVSMNNHNVRHLPILKGRDLVGMVGIKDILPALVELGRGALTEGLSFGPLAGPGDSEGGGFE